MVDLHSYGETILHSWSGDQNQSQDPDMNFANPAYHGKRGLINDDVYREYMPAGDEKLAVSMAKRMAGAISKVRGQKYLVQQSVGLYPTVGSTDDYAYSRHLLDPAKPKTISYTVEFGRNRAPSSSARSVQTTCPSISFHDSFHFSERICQAASYH